MLEYKKVFLFNGKDVALLSEKEKEDARKCLNHALVNIPCISQDEELFELLQPKKKIDIALIELDSAIEDYDEKTRIALRVAFRRIIWRYYGEE